MRKLAAIYSSISYLLFAKLAFAETIHIMKPANAGYGDIGSFINAGLRLAFIIALLAVLVMFVWGAVQWILSGGEKEAVGEARKRILNSIIGLVILAVAFAVVSL